MYGKDVDFLKISTKGRYALRLMLDLAVNDTGECISLKSIAARQEISEKYLEQIIPILSKAGFVRSVRGANGGYRLSKPAKDYTVGQILRLTEGSLAPVACLEDEKNNCTRSSDCTTLYVWKKLYEAINGVVDGITLLELVEMERQRGANDYVI